MVYIKEKAKPRWTIKLMKVYRQFCGWDTLLDLIGMVRVGLKGWNGETLIHDEVEENEGRALIATTFETGARIQEALQMRVRDFRFEEDRVYAIFNIVKRYRKERRVIKYRATDGTKLRWDTEEEAKASGHPYEPYEGYTTRKEIEIRNIAFPRREPLVPIMEKWIKFVSETKGENAYLFNINYNKAYRIIRRAGEEMGQEWTPHRLRAERATQLAIEYEFSDHELTEWFAWRNPAVAHDYTTLAPKIIEKMFKP